MFKVEVPNTGLVTGYESSDPDIRIIANLYNLSDYFVEYERMVHYIPWTKYTATRESSGQSFDKFIMWTIQGKLSEEQLKEIQSNPYFIQCRYEKDPIDLTSIWLELQEGLEDKITIFTKEENS